MNLAVLLGTLGAGVGLAAGLAFSVRLSGALGSPLAATLVNFLVGGVLMVVLWGLGLDGARPAQLPEGWMLTGGLLGAAYVTLSLLVAARLGVGVSTVAVTLGQLLGALVIPALGWLGQTRQAPTPGGLLSAALLAVAVALLASDRQQGEATGAETR
ncbi:DMT family transporter [Deinococcus aluminii]|uniref:DMT family transporter n=1 Tax=Deinococcus aluminii TaxID=1656885 RepID=A0ABP9XF52_9DEIO